MNGLPVGIIAIERDNSCKSEAFSVFSRAHKGKVRLRWGISIQTFECFEHLNV